MRYIIVGGAGFLGQYIVDLISEKLAKNDQIIILDISKPKKLPFGTNFFCIDITKKIDFEFLRDDVVVHLAARQYHLKPPRKNRREYFFDTNVLGTKNLLEKMEKDGCNKMIYFSTDMVYGKPEYLPINSRHCKNPFGEYGKSKLECERLCEHYRKKGFSITIFRPRMIVGKGRFGILIKLFKLMEMGLPIPMIGSGNNCYQMVSVRDCASAIWLALQKGIPNVELNLGSKNPPKVKDLLKKMVAQTGSKSWVIPTYGRFVKYTLGFLGFLGLEIMYKEQYKIADEEYVVDITEARDILGWEPMQEDGDMLIEAYNEYKASKEK
ncbi:NAD-dependent epimerase/dehydratase family protein [Helicobacter cappadocius]|uniref:NAD(P)-dependent oxidoreductase n=1 Tax=Helicobacter cappadocius TaxID=3063998 RepID=A0AA90PSQ9_9HELI|nr:MULTISPECIES: NAD(P)-dependent oxidoreductase [unclassified Helicobacter]MDO7253544.1 NAD(P)-dependent oxidoreductase [Helicobacter sp. faydin-H75]MDP2539472.1 NAD(P)-dependent oxidoreductase [Helicobacter sp. faydin-H76]